MTRLTRSITLLIATVAVVAVAAGCGGNPPSPALTDPTEIVQAALRSTAAAKSVHLDVKVDGTAAVALPGIGTGTGTPVKVDGTTASVDVDFAAPAAHATFAAPSLLGFAGELIAVNGKSYLKTTLTGPLYQESAAAAGPIDPGSAGSVIDNLGDALTKEGVVLTKGADEKCGSEQCYTVTTKLTADQLGAGQAASAGGLPIDLTGATLDLKVLVEQDAPNHLAGIDGTLTMADGSALTFEIAASRWDQPVTITAPPADKVKPAS